MSLMRNGIRHGLPALAAVLVITAMAAGCGAAQPSSPGNPQTTANARFTMAQLEGFRDRVTADLEYWRKQGITIIAVVPRADGSGLDVLTAVGSAREREALAERYPDIPIEVRQETVVFPTASPAPPIRLSAPPPSKTIQR